MLVELDVLPVLAPPFPAVPDREEPVLTPLDDVVLAVVQLRSDDEWMPWWSKGGIQEGLNTPPSTSSKDLPPHSPATSC